MIVWYTNVIFIKLNKLNILRTEECPDHLLFQPTRCNALTVATMNQIYSSALIPGLNKYIAPMKMKTPVLSPSKKRDITKERKNRLTYILNINVSKDDISNY